MKVASVFLLVDTQPQLTPHLSQENKIKYKYYNYYCFPLRLTDGFITDLSVEYSWGGTFVHVA